MKVAVINFSGNVGKTTVAAHLLHPRMDNAPIISVESLNLDARSDGVDVEQLRAKQFVGLIEQLMVRESAIVDVGASNVEEFMRGMRALQGSHEEFDAFVVPTVSTKKQVGDTINTVIALGAIGVEPKRIRIVFNKVSEGDKVSTMFAGLLEAIRSDAGCIAKPSSVIYANEVYDLLKEVGRSLADIRADSTPWRARVRELPPGAEQNQAIRMLTLKRLSMSASENLDAVFEELFA